jgi:hypothetical protein
MNTASQLSDVAALRERARKHVEDGAVTAGYDADRTQVLKLLNEALATELVCVYCAIAAITSWRAAFTRSRSPASS